MTENISKLLALVDEFPKIKRVEYENPEHQEFVTRVLTALKSAGPEVRVLCEIESSKMVDELRANNEITKSLIDQLRKMVTRPPTTPTSAPVELTRFASPNSAFSPSPETERNTHIQVESQNTAGNGEVLDQTVGTGGTPASSASTLADARKAAALSKAPSEEKTKAPATRKRNAAPRRAQSSIP